MTGEKCEMRLTNRKKETRHEGFGHPQAAHKLEKMARKSCVFFGWDGIVWDDYWLKLRLADRLGHMGWDGMGWDGIEWERIGSDGM